MEVGTGTCTNARDVGTQEILERTRTELNRAHEIVGALAEYLVGQESQGVGGDPEPRSFGGLRGIIDDNEKSVRELVSRLEVLFDRLEPAGRGKGSREMR